MGAVELLGQPVHFGPENVVTKSGHCIYTILVFSHLLLCPIISNFLGNCEKVYLYI